MLYHTLSDNADLSEQDLDEAYLHLCDHQIMRIQFGGYLCIPERKIPLHRALFTPRPLNYRIKAILKHSAATIIAVLWHEPVKY